MKTTIGEIKQLIKEAITPETQREAVEIFTKTFGKNALGTHKFSFAKSADVDGQQQFWFYTNPMEFIYKDRMKTSNFSRPTEADDQKTMQQLLNRLKKNCPPGWAAVARQNQDGWHLVLVK